MAAFDTGKRLFSTEEVLEILDNDNNNIFHITNKDNCFEEELTQYKTDSTVNLVAMWQDVLLEEGELNNIDMEIQGNEFDHAAITPDGEDFNICPIDSVVHGDMDNSPVIAKKRSRIRSRNPSNWKAALRQKRCQQGKSYVSVRNKLVPAKAVKTSKDCTTSCRFNCANNIDSAKREEIFKEFYVLEQSNKHQFIFNSSEYDAVSRKTCENSRRAKSLKYFFEINDVKIRVCKPFYLGTLSIIQKMVYNVHMKQNPLPGTPKVDGRGKHMKHISADKYMEVRNHRIFSYCKFTLLSCQDE